MYINLLTGQRRKTHCHKSLYIASPNQNKIKKTFFRYTDKVERKKNLFWGVMNNLIVYELHFDKQGKNSQLVTLQYKGFKWGRRK